MDVAQKTAGNGSKSRPESGPKSRSKSGAGSKPRSHRIAQARCPLRYGEPCTLCQPGAHGPEDCQTVAMVMADPDLREMMVEMNREHRKNSDGGLATR
ncbi:DUF6767 domain-containing protein [uncultured Corynebacterium sp.]|uniref:DUF6767 domain-containing protein n=1 Tax=uncultured Corynebacterium sp. TaxID=159447 RepID=UPI0025E6F6A5|nr:DUF6767 domain-containing protein [uncultured Corynebacterium sp.]